MKINFIIIDKSRHYIIILFKPYYNPIAKKKLQQPRPNSPINGNRDHRQQTDSLVAVEHEGEHLAQLVSEVPAFLDVAAGGERQVDAAEQQV